MNCWIIVSLILSAFSSKVRTFLKKFPKSPEILKRVFNHFRVRYRTIVKIQVIEYQVLYCNLGFSPDSSSVSLFYK